MMCSSRTSIFVIVTIACMMVGLVDGANVGYTFDGVGNNVDNPLWGAVGSPLVRVTPVTYADGISEPRGGLDVSASSLPNPRVVSNLIFGRDHAGGLAASTAHFTDLLVFFGQFIDHDTGFVLDTDCADFKPLTDPCTECDEFHIPVPVGDPFLDPQGVGARKHIPFCRSQHNNGSPREVVNSLSNFIDCSHVYGNSDEKAAALREGAGGRMLMEPGADGPFPPLNVGNRPDGTRVATINGNRLRNLASMLAIGDLRGNESPLLLSFHTLWLREHNRLAATLTGTDEEIYQQARAMCIGYLQHIFQTEFLPSLLGMQPGPYRGYNASVNPTASSWARTVSFRALHDAINSIILRVGPEGTPSPMSHMLLRDAFFNPDAVVDVGISDFFRGAMMHLHAKMDGQMVDDVRQLLFDVHPDFASDLTSRNIQRGRDHGIGTYAQAREAFGLEPCVDFSCITSDLDLQQRLGSVYASVHDVDGFVGAMLEDKAATDVLGSLNRAVTLETFDRLRHGDRFWYENPGVYTAEELADIQATSLADIIKRNTNVERMPDNVFELLSMGEQHVTTVNFQFGSAQ